MDTVAYRLFSNLNSGAAIDQDMICPHVGLSSGNYDKAAGGCEAYRRPRFLTWACSPKQT